MKYPDIHLPHIGMRIIKSSAAVFLCYIIYLLRGRQGAVFYTQLAVLWCIQPYVDTSLKKALQRTVGTFIGAFFGLLVLLFSQCILHSDPKFELLEYTIISIMIIPIIYTTVLLHKKDASYFSCVVFLSIVVIHMADVNPFFFVWERVSDTMIGILVGVLVNSFHLPHKKRFDLLFVSGLDDTLLNQSNHLSDYSIVELNQMLDAGINFTISTVRTPASLIEPMKDIRLRLPVIAMDGAVLYDIRKKTYLKSYVISYSKTRELIDFICSRGFQCFINVILEDTLVIYHQDLINDAEKDIYCRMYSSPYRNYLYHELPEGYSCIYLMIIDKTEKTEQLFSSLTKEGYGNQMKILHYPSDEYKGYSYIKIYNKNAQKENMMHYLQSTLNCSQAITFGSIEGKYDYVIHPHEADLVVRYTKKLFEPLGFERQKK